MTLSLFMADIIKMFPLCHMQAQSHDDMMVCMRVQRVAVEVTIIEREVHHHHPGFSQRFEVEHARVMCLVKQCVLNRQQSALFSVLSSGYAVRIKYIRTIHL